MIKELKKGNYTLTHDRYIDDFGFKKDAFDLFDETKRIHYPFHAPIKATNYKRDEPIQTTTDYTDEEYSEMLDKQIQKYEKHTNI